MNKTERQDAVVKILILMEPLWGHEDRCPGRRDAKTCNCFLLRNAKNRAAALDEAGLLSSVAKRKA